MDSSTRALLVWLWFVAFCSCAVGGVLAILSVPVTLCYTLILIAVFAIIIR